MSINDVLQRLIDDGAFREAFLDDADRALAGLELNDADRQALLSGELPSFGAAEGDTVDADLVAATNEAFGDKCPQRVRMA